MAQQKPGHGWANPVYQVGRGKTLGIPMEVHGVAREKLVAILAERGVHDGVVLLQGGEDGTYYDSDADILFKQDSWVSYLFGVKEAGVYGAIDLASKKSYLFIPKLPESYSIWCGEIHPPSDFRISYAVDEVLYIDDLSSWLKDRLLSDNASGNLHLLSGVNSDSGKNAHTATFQDSHIFHEAGKVDTSKLFHALSTARLTKSSAEVNVMHYCCHVASNAHVAVMRSAKEASFEYELEAKFLYEIYKNGGCRRAAYVCICGTGPNGAVLHYGHAAAPNDRQISEGDMALLDMGAEYHGYVSDITCSFPVFGKFSEDQKVIYEGVLAAQGAVMNAMKPGFDWPSCHLLAEREILKALHKAGILHNGTIDDFVNAELGPVFFPHGLGHLIGCDTHDVGGYIDGAPERGTRAGLNKLRTSRTLEEGMALTNEPGCYFIDVLIEKAIADPSKAKFLNAAVLDRFRKFGGVRLEDVVVVTNDGVINLTTCPRTVAEVESVIAGGAWPPAVDEAPQLRRQWAKLSADATTMERLPL